MTPPLRRPEDLQRLLDDLAAREHRDGGPLAGLRDRVRRLARQHLAARDPLRALFDSEDLTQDTLLDLIQQVHRFRGATWPEFLAFVAALMQRRLAAAGRRARAGNRDLGRAAPMPRPDPVHPRSDPPSAAARREEHARLERRLAALPDGLQQALRRRLAGEDYAVIARALGIAEANARQRVSRALRLLKDMDRPVTK